MVIYTSRIAIYGRKIFAGVDIFLVEARFTGSLSGECTISLYEVLARVHGVKIVPLINSIMTTIMKTLASSAGSFPLQQACSKVAPAIALYGIDPTNPEDKKRHMSDRMTYVSRAAFEALQTARRRAAGKGSKLEKAPGSASGSNFSRRDHRRRRNLSSASDHCPASVSPESQTLDSFAEYDSFVETPIRMSCQCSRNSIYDCRSANRKLWSHENGGVDVSLKDGLFSEIAQGSAYSNGYPGNLGINEFMKCEGDSNEEFTGFQQTNPKNGVSRSATTSPWRFRTPLNVDSIIFNTPSRLVHSLQEPNNADSK
ncbi:hypothetical protein ACFX11_008393 [Malus domestica]